MLSRLIFFVLLPTFALASKWEDPQFLNLYQYKSTNSVIESPFYFFSPEGAISPEAEYLSALHVFRNDISKSWGVQKDYAACVFPARRRVLERLSGEVFPRVQCNDLQSWRDRIAAQSVRIVFAGSFMNNPASLFGHVFLRLDNPLRSDLLSYSVGYLAQTPVEDGPATYTYRGITGKYPGYYEIKPHYMNIGLYNNSESRDLWEYELNLSKQEVDFLVDHLWEVSMNAQYKYYFFDENCAFRLLTLLQTVRPDARVDMTDWIFVPPAEVVRILRQHDWVGQKSRYRPSIFKKIVENYKVMTPQEKRELLEGTSKSEASLNLWLYRTYKNKTKLLPEDQEKLNQVLQERSKMQFSEQQVEIENNYSPDLGHKPHWLEVGLLKERLSVSGFMGTHSMEQYSRGYDFYSSISVFGLMLKYDLMEKKTSDYRITFAKIRSYQTYDEIFKSKSWDLDFAIDNDIFVSSAGVGYSYLIGPRNLTFLHGALDLSLQKRLGVLPGVDLGWVYEKSNFKIFAVYKPRRSESGTLLNHWAIESSAWAVDQVDRSYYLRAEHAAPLQNLENLELGLRQNF